MAAAAGVRAVEGERDVAEARPPATGGDAVATRTTEAGRTEGAVQLNLTSRRSRALEEERRARMSKQEWEAEKAERRLKERARSASSKVEAKVAAPKTRKTRCAGISEEEREARIAKYRLRNRARRARMFEKEKDLLRARQRARERARRAARSEEAREGDARPPKKQRLEGSANENEGNPMTLPSLAAQQWFALNALQQQQLTLQQWAMFLLQQREEASVRCVLPDQRAGPFSVSVAAPVVAAPAVGPAHTTDYTERVARARAAAGYAPPVEMSDLSAGYRVATQSALAFETDVPPSRAGRHLSGVLHATAKERGTPCEDALVWVEDRLRIQAPLASLHRRGYSPASIVFVPFSSEGNWRRRFPWTVSRLEGVRGKVGDKGESARKGMSSHPRLNDLERDELHVEIWKYFRWLCTRLVSAQGTEAPAEADPAAETSATKLSGDGDAAAADDQAKQAKTVGAGKRRKKAALGGVDLSELQCIVDKMETAFPIMAVAKLEHEAQLKLPEKTSGFAVFAKEQKQASKAKAVAVSSKEHQTMMEGLRRRWKEMTEESRSVYHEKAAKDTERNALDAVREGRGQSKTEPAPFLETSLPKALCGLVTARKAVPRRKTGSGLVVGSFDFEACFQRLVEFQEENGHCRVTKAHKDKELARWVLNLRIKRGRLDRRGLAAEELASWQRKTGTTLTADRIERLDALGFPWRKPPASADTGLEAGSAATPQQPSAPRGETAPATLSENPRTLMCLWIEYKHGIDGRLPAEKFSPSERTAGATKQKYWRRNMVWKAIAGLVKSGSTPESAILQIQNVYGHSTSVSEVINSMIRDKRKYPGGIHPKLLISEPDPPDEPQLPAILSENPRTLMRLWEEYKVGLNGRKPAEEFTMSEKNANRITKQKYWRRNFVWKTIARLVSRGQTAEEAIARIQSTYGENGKDASLSKIVRAMIKDKRKYPGGVHPNLS